jgi:3-dehydroquinate synthase
MEDIPLSENLLIKSRFHDYSVTFCDVRQKLPEVLKPGDVIVVDSAVFAAHTERLAPAFEGHAVIEVDGSERSKSFEVIGGTLEAVVQGGFRKSNRLIAVGGGAVQDVVAFMAQNLYRGVDYLFVPTTLLAQGDSCLGGKSSINFRGYKNLLGSFLPPREILVDVAFVETLPAKELTSGIGEILHFLIFQDEENFAFLEKHIDTIRGDGERMRELAARSLAIKKAVVERDELDKGERQLFNYGHTFGHAIEAVTEYSIPHGISVSMGIDIANYVSVGLGHADGAFRDRVRAVASKLWPGFSIRDVDLDAYFAALRRDKKNVGNDVYAILTRGFGGLVKTKIELEGRAGELIREYFATQAP